MIDRKQIPMIDPQKWPHLIHMGYVTENVRRIRLEWTTEAPAPAKLQPYIDAVLAAAEKEDTDFKISQKSDYTERVTEADKERDSLLGQVQGMVDAFAKMDAMPQKKQAALTMKGPLDFYKPSAKAALSDETTQIKQWHQAYSESIAQQAAANELGLTAIIAQLVEKNDLVEELMASRADEQAAKADIKLKADRQAYDEAMRDLTMVLNALHLLEDSAERYAAIVSGLTQTQELYRQRYEDNRRANKRVYVASDIVGNHYYQVSSGWTWATLAQKNPKALALDPAPSAPGVEPVVVPVRIVSADKLALKAGGLQVALDGQPVKPGDEVDAAKNYELVGINGGSDITPVVPE